ncbi:MAG: hypothetical protein RL642_662 [Bacteroidota bacterium]|jgi:hypothetical protein
MFHVKHIVVVLCVAPLLAVGQAQFSLQDKKFVPEAQVDDELMDYVIAQTKGRGLTEQEKQFFYWSCFLRLNPKRFSAEVLAPFLASFPEAKGKEAASLQKELNSLTPMPQFKHSILLADLALEHASDLSEHGGRLTHTDSKGRAFPQRMKMGGVTKCAAENLYTGKNDGLLALLMLLLDIGLESAGHRKNILNPNHLTMGVSIRPGATLDQVILVQLFGCN